MRTLAAVAACALVLVAATPAHATNDPYFYEQWGLAKIRAVDAWSASRGAGVTIAIVDSGVESTHPDLSARMRSGYDFVDRDADPSPGHGHGTHVAGIAAATADNGQGVAGVAPLATIMPVRVLNNEGTGTVNQIAAGILWAAENGADVINLSLGNEVFPVDPTGTVDLAVARALAAGAVVVASAGNEATPYCHMPSFNPGAICVGNSTRTDTLSPSSNYGLRIDLVAPGSGIISTWTGGRYATAGGTSMAAPHVSGVAALLVAMGASAAEAGSIIRRSARDIGTTGYDPVYGWGVLDARKAVEMCASECSLA